MTDSIKLKELLGEIKGKSESIVEQAGEIQKTGYLIKEFADLSISYFDQSPMADFPNTYIDDFQIVSNDLDKMGNQIGSMASLASGLAYGTANAMATVSGISTNYTYRSNPSYSQYYSQFDQVVDRGEIKDKVIFGIKKLGLNSTKDGQISIEMINAAWEVHMHGIGSSTSSLIPLRESIAKALQSISRKTSQTKIKKWITDLISKVAYSNINANEIQDLQKEHNILRDLLSESKNGLYSREEERRILRDGTLHLLKIINIIDFTKLK